MQARWVVVADAARARIFKVAGRDSHLDEVEDLVHPESRLHAGDLRTGGEGAQSESTGPSLRATGPEVETGDKHAERFAKEVAQFLRDGRVHGRYDELWLVAAPAFLGHLRDKLDEPTARCVVHSIDKDWAHHERREIEQLLARQ